MSFSSTHQKIVRLNDFDLRDLGGTASFEAQAISGRGLAPTRERELQFPGEMGSRDYGSYYSNRRIEISGILYADTMSDFRVGLDKLKEICRLRTFVDGVLYEQVEAQTLWLADESVIIGPYTGLGGIAGGGTWVSFIKDSDIPSRYASGGAESIVDTGNIGLKLELITSATAALVSTWDIIAIGPDHGSAPADSTSIYLSPASGPDAAGDQAVIRDDRYWLVNYSGSMNEERLTTQWYKTGYSRVTLPFKCVYPFAVSDPKLVDFVPNATNGYFKSIDTGNAISYPVYKIKGAADTPQVVETTHSLVWNANDNNATNILGDTVGATVSAAGFYGQTGKLNQAIAFDANLDKTQGDSAAVTNTAIRSALGIGSGLNYNQGTIGFWAKKAGDWYDDGTSPTIGQKYIINNYSGSTGISIYEAPSDSKIYFYVNDQSASYAYSLSAGNWFYFILRWDTRRTGFSSASSSAYLVLEVYDTSGNLLDSGTGTNTSDPAEAAAVNTSLYLSSDGTDEYFDGLIDDLAIWDRPLTDTERNTLVNSGTGVRADTVASSELVYYSDFDQTVGTTFDDEQIASSNMDTAQVSATTTTTATVAGYGDKIFPGTERFVLYDETGYKVQSTVATSADTSITYASLSGADEVGVYATLNGSSQYFNAGNVGAMTAADFSVSCWFKTSHTGGTAAQTMVGRGAASNYNLNCFINTDGTPRVAIYQPAGATYAVIYGTDSVADGKWHHYLFAYTHSSTTLYLFIDGVQVATTSSVTGSLGSTTADLNIGRLSWGDTNYFNGSLRDVAVWTGSSKNGQALALAANPLDATTSGGSQPTEWWKLTDANFSTSAASSGSGGTDATNNGTVARTQLAYISRNLIADGGMENGGIGSLYQVNTDATVSKETVTVRKDAQAIKLTNAVAGQRSFEFNPSTLSGEDYIIRGWIYTPSGNTYASGSTLVYYGALNTTVGQQLGGSFTAGDNAWHFVEAAAEASGSSLNFDFYNGSSVSGETGYWDDLKLLPNLVNNGGMEGTYVAAGGAALGDIAPGWQKVYDYASTTYSEDLSEHSGSAAQKIACSLGQQNGIVSQVNVSLVAGQWYEQAMWFKSDAGQAVTLTGYSLGAPSVWSYSLPAGSAWHRHSFIFRADTTGSANLYIYTNGLSGSQSWYVDDVSVVHRPDLSVSFNNMTTGYRFEPTRLTRGYKTGNNEDFSFAGLVCNPDDMAIRMVVRPQFPSTSGSSTNLFLLVLENDYTDDLHAIWFEPTTDKFRFWRYQASTGLSASAYSPVMNFSQDDEIELGASFDTTTGTKFYVNGSNAGATNDATTTAVTTIPDKAWVGRYYYAGYNGDYIIDDLEILAKSQPAEWFAEKHAKRNQAKNLNLPFKWSGTLSAGDILTVNALDPKVAGRVSMYDASAGTSSNQMSDADVSGSLMPILSPTKSMLYFPNSIPAGVEIYYRENHQ